MEVPTESLDMSSWNSMSVLGAHSHNVSKPIGTRHHGTMLQPTIVRWLGTNVSMVPTRDVLMVWRQLGMNVLRDEGVGT